MIIVNLDGLIHEMQLRIGYPVTIADISRATGIGADTLRRMRRRGTQVLWLSALERLSVFFGCEKRPDKLLLYVPGDSPGVKMLDIYGIGTDQGTTS